MLTFWSNHERTRGPGPAISFATSCAIALLLVSLACSVFAQGASIGLYSDASGNTCSFSGDAPGLVTAYVVVRPEQAGVSAVRFSAPVPACFGATFLGEATPPGALLLGSSQTGASIALQQCSVMPVNVLQITYQRTGGTTPCCEYTIAADPSAGQLAATNCWYQDIPLTAVTSHFNADETCECVGNSPPNIPVDPSPPDGAPSVSVSTSMGWFGFDPDGNLAGFDVYLGTTPSPSLVASDISVPSFTPSAPLEPLTQYYWRVVARDAMGLETSSATWTFTTRLVNSPPNIPTIVSPADGGQDVRVDAILRWFTADIDGDPLVHDVYFGSSSPPPLVATGIAGDARYLPGTLEFATTYYWRVVARDPLGQETSGPEWSFTTRPSNYPPNPPGIVAPPNGALGQLLNTTLSWTATDIDPDALVSDVYFGTTTPPPLAASGQSSTTYAPPGLAFSTQYRWRIVVRDPHGLETTGPVWTFTTRPENYPPNAPVGPSPASGAMNQSESTTLAWQCSDLDGHTITYDVYFGTATSPPLVASNVATNAYAPGLLAFGTTYRWRIVARDELGAETSGPLWVFSTFLNQPPSVPASPSPSNGSTNRPIAQTIGWQCSDPNGHALAYDVYFGTDDPPSMAASNVAQNSYAPGTLAFSTTYRWYIVARDPFGLERTGPTWGFTTKANSPPTTPGNPSPGNHGLSDATPVLTWTSGDADGQPLTFDVYFGTSSPLPLVASGLTQAMYEPGEVVPAQLYSWRVVASDGLTSTNGPVWDFRVLAMGDANSDLTVDLEDAECALGMYIGFGACNGFDNAAADVDCNDIMTPRDARCIHKHVVDGSCSFCDGATTEPAGVSTPVVYVSSTTEWNDTVYVRLAVSGVPSLEAFGFVVQSNADYMRATRRGATTDFVELRNGPFPLYAIVGGYSLTGSPANSAVDFIDLRFYSAYWYDRMLYIFGFVDDLLGAAPLYVYAGGGGLPVLITRFEATPVEGGVDVRWDLESDEAMESFTLYRREDGAALPIEAATGAATTRAYLDTSVEGGKTYRYELMIRTAGGDEFRSQVATVSTPATELVLGQNHPNPFNPRTVIPYDLPASAKPERVRLWILDIAGRVVATLVDEEQGGGSYRVPWQGRDDRGQAVSSGVYFYVLDVGGERRTRKLVLLK